MYQNKSNDVMQYHYENFTDDVDMQENKALPSYASPSSMAPHLVSPSPLNHAPYHSPSAYSLTDAYKKFVSYF
jgi:hypothetical protein